jgi:hypothetical protein
MKDVGTINIMYSKDFISSDESREVRVKQLISKSKMKPSDARRLGEELKTNWWEQNKERFLSKINRD